MPQPRKQDTAEETPATPEVKLPPNLRFAEENDPEVHRLLEDAQRLDAEKDEVYGRIAANRDVLRNYVKMGRASEEQARAAYAFYPHREVKRGNGTASA